MDNISPRENVIPGSKDDTFHVDPYHSSHAGALTATVTLNAAAMQAINTTPQELVPAPADGASIDIISIRVQKAAGGFSGSNPLQFRYGTGASVAEVPAAILTGGGATNAYADPVTPSTPLPPADMALNAYASANYTGAGGAVTITVKYVLAKDE